MRLNTIRIHHMAESVIERLEAQGLLQIQGKKDLVVQQLETAITTELQAEDRLNADVREMLKQFDQEFAAGSSRLSKNVFNGQEKTHKRTGYSFIILLRLEHILWPSFLVTKNRCICPM